MGPGSDSGGERMVRWCRVVTTGATVVSGVVTGRFRVVTGGAAGDWEVREW